jgi:hypothetical protein
MAKKRRVVKPVKISSCKPCGLNAPKFGLALGIILGLAMLIIGISATYANYGANIVALCSSIYIGYDITLVGSIVGGIWGFLDGLVGGFIFAWLYNKLL